MIIRGITICRWNSDTPDAVILDAAWNLAEYGYFQKGPVKEFLTFATKTLMGRLPAGVQCVDYEGAWAWVGSDPCRSPMEQRTNHPPPPLPRQHVLLHDRGGGPGGDRVL